MSLELKILMMSLTIFKFGDENEVDDKRVRKIIPPFYSGEDTELKDKIVYAKFSCLMRNGHGSLWNMIERATQYLLLLMA